jgi:hypothetical protein
LKIFAKTVSLLWTRFLLVTLMYLVRVYGHSTDTETKCSSKGLITWLVDVAFATCNLLSVYAITLFNITVQWHSASLKVLYWCIYISSNTPFKCRMNAENFSLVYSKLSQLYLLEELMPFKNCSSIHSSLLEFGPSFWN